MDERPEATDAGDLTPGDQTSVPDNRRIALLPVDLEEEDLDQEHLLLAMACRSALDISRQADLRPDPAIQTYLRAVLQGRRAAGPGRGLRHPRVPVSQAVLGVAAALFVSFVPDRLIPTANHLPLDLLVNCQVVQARIDAYAGLEKLTAIGDQKLRAGQVEGEAAIRHLVPTAPPADST